jgi:hypothetical protein
MSELRPVCFVISPFGEPFDEYYREIYQPAIEAVGLVPLRADEIFRPGVFMQDVFENIDSCTVAPPTSPTGMPTCSTNWASCTTTSSERGQPLHPIILSRAAILAARQLPSARSPIQNLQGGNTG